MAFRNRSLSLPAKLTGRCALALSITIVLETYIYYGKISWHLSDSFFGTHLLNYYHRYQSKAKGEFRNFV